MVFLLMSFFICFSAQALTTDEARHFLSRTHFSVSINELKQLEKKSRHEAVNWLFAKESIKTAPAQPFWLESYQEVRRQNFLLKKGIVKADERTILALKQDVKNILAPIQNLIPQNLKNKLSKEIQSNDPKQLTKLLRKIGRRILNPALQSWWVGHMVQTPTPLTEKMTLFWHNHFPSSVVKVKNLAFLYQQNIIFRKNALGTFRNLLFEISKDPAMLIYLDGDKNSKKKPNENFAREVMELFTLGEGYYTEKDIKEAARAFSGWGFNRRNGNFVFRKKRHDHGVKTFLGQSGKWQGNDILRILLSKRQTANYLVQKIWRYFCGVDVSQELLARLSELFFNSGYDIKKLLREIFVSDEFYTSQGELIKSPVELVVGSLQEFEIETDQYFAFVHTMGQLGQSLFNPPNVKGWPGGKYWINSASLVQRKSFLSRLVRVAERKMNGKTSMQGMRQMNVQVDFNQWIKRFVRQEDLLKVMLPFAPVNSLEGKKGPELILSVLLDPTYQLK